MRAEDRDLFVLVQDFLMLHVIQDATAAAHHQTAEKLYATIHLRVTRPRPFLEHFLRWRHGPENAVRDNPRAELMVYQALFPGRMIDLLLELT
jgi:hypothetical protein